VAKLIHLNDTVTLNEPDEGEWTPAGDYKVTALHTGLEQGGFSVDGRCTVIWPHRVVAVNGVAVEKR
jgi:hypothetical protein